MNPGQLVLVTLNNPREKFWGVMLSLTPAGVSVRGVDLQSLDDFTQLIKSGEPASASVVFFPMHRLQRIEEDEPSALKGKLVTTAPLRMPPQRPRACGGRNSVIAA